MCDTVAIIVDIAESQPYDNGKFTTRPRFLGALIDVLEPVITANLQHGNWLEFPCAGGTETPPFLQGWA